MQLISIRMAVFLAFIVLTISSHAIEPETVGQTRMGTPTDKWFMVKDVFGSANIFDSSTGEMQGLISLSLYTPAVQPGPRHKLIYAAETYYSRQFHGERTDIITAYDMSTLSPSFEIDIPNKTALLPFRQYIALLDDERHLAVFNMTPAQSVSIVDLKSRSFSNEISTPGCALILPVKKRGFLMICGDGTLQLIKIDNKGNETSRLRSAAFFNIDEDPVYDKPVPLNDGRWQLISFEGKAFEVSAENDSIAIGEPWSLISDEDATENWRLGGGQLLDVHTGLNLLFVIVHQGEKDTHEDAGTEIWIFDRSTQRRIARMVADEPMYNLMVTQDEDPNLIVSTETGKVHIYNVKTTKLLRTIEDTGVDPALLQRF